MIIRFINSRLQSIKNAIIGWWHVIRTQKNAWIHLLATVTVVLISIWVNLSIQDWSVLLLIIALVWIAEFLNTALEIIVDLVSPDMHPLARVGKDVGAAAVLIAAAVAVIIGILLLGPPLMVKVNSLLPMN